MNTLRCISGILLLLISFGLFYFRFDVIKNLFKGNPAPLEELVAPLVLFVFGVLVLLLKKNEQSFEQPDV